MHASDANWYIELNGKINSFKLFKSLVENIPDNDKQCNF